MMNWHVDDGGDADDDDNWSCYLKIRGELCASVLLQFPELGFRSSKELGNSLVFEAREPPAEAGAVATAASRSKPPWRERENNRKRER
ncbi:uncharacterized protein LOC141642162 isoform X4 [Silene latifolia]|uniref:uncharacterized protein LOC141642162 isoform X4 n=1 Tax=Silene latifolia TaxID=37657 RepID=UPI003D774316